MHSVLKKEKKALEDKQLIGINARERGIYGEREREKVISLFE